ncbi:MAG: hypothetical protein IJM76_10350 [Lachnospiraceae bacterium]|nr:hypothetical protein [Lachnospiraceae bacterium]
MLKVLVLVLLLSFLFGPRRGYRGSFYGWVPFFIGIGVVRIVVRVVLGIFLLMLFAMAMAI